MANFRLCSIPECGKPVRTKGYCNAHYLRLWRHGDPLGGNAHPGEPLRFIHEVAIHHVGDECLTWPYAKTKGYGSLQVDGKSTLSHRYLCELVYGAPPTPKHEAAHLCGKGHEGCIAPGHLEWKTPTANHADKLIHGTHNRGERCAMTKLTETDVQEIITLKEIETQSKIAKRFGVGRQTISAIHRGVSWSWLTGVSNPSPNVVIE